MTKKGAKSKYSILSNVFFTFRNIWKWDKLLFLTVFLSIIALVATPTLGIYMPKFVIQFLEQQRPLKDLMILLGVLAGFAIIIGQMDSFSGAYNRWAKTLYRTKLVRVLSNKYLTSFYSYIASEEGQKSGEKAQRSITSNGRGTEDIIPQIINFASNALGIILYVSILSALSPLVVVILIVCGVISFFAGSAVNKYYQKHKDKISKLQSKLYYSTYSSKDPEYAKDIRLYGMYGWVTDLCMQFIKERKEWDKKQGLRLFSSRLLEGGIVFIRDGFAYIYLIYLVLNSTISVADFVLFIGAVTGFSAWVMGFAKSIIELQRGSIDISDFREFTEADEGINTENKIMPQNSYEYQHSIEFKNVSFSYGEKQVYKDFNLKIEAGKKIALVGANGAGKTTLVKLLLNLYKPDSGTILMDDNDISLYDTNYYYSLFSVSFQDALITAFTLCENIAMQDMSDIDQDKMDEIIKISGLENKVRELKKGKFTSIEKILDDEGVELSGGERQKIILARALYKDAPFLILDEPTSALDPIAESELYNRYHEIAKDKTSIYISHRLASTQFCDEIIVLDEGEIIERGTHEELIKSSGKYAYMFKVQSHYYQDQVEEAI